MLPNLRRRAPALVVCASLSTLAIAACGGSSSDDGAPVPQTSSPTPTTSPAPSAGVSTSATQAGAAQGARIIDVALAGGQVRGGRRTEKVELGEEVRIRAVSDVAEELHVHTYDRRVALQPSQPAEIVIPADIPGRHEVEFERSRRQALTLEVG